MEESSTTNGSGLPDLAATPVAARSFGEVSGFNGLRGIALLIVGPSERGGWPLVHKASFLVWIGATALHVLGHLPGMPAALRASRHQRAGLGMRSPGEAWLWVALAGACAVGLVLALVLAGQFDPWTTARSFTHPHHLQ